MLPFEELEWPQMEMRQEIFVLRDSAGTPQGVTEGLGFLGTATAESEEDTYLLVRTATIEGALDSAFEQIVEVLQELGSRSSNYDRILELVRSFWFSDWRTSYIGWGPGAQRRVYSFPLMMELVMHLIREEYGDQEVAAFWNVPIHYMQNDFEEIEWPSQMF